MLRAHAPIDVEITDAVPGRRAIDSPQIQPSHLVVSSAVDDSASAGVGSPVKINVLANDSDPDGDLLTVTWVSDPANGSAAINPDKIVTYKPDGCFVGTDTFTYWIDDGKGGSDSGVVKVQVRKTRGSTGCSRHRLQKGDDRR
jgi:hypothetical protein